MKRFGKLALLVFVLAALVIIPACHEHVWLEATCTEPKTCEKCKKTEGEPLGHEWQAATCTEPKTCSRCGETEGEPLGHNWMEPTCTTPKTCRRCNGTEGEALGHTVETWVVVTPSTCVEKGVESGVCTVCGETVERELDLVDHTPGDWVVIKEPTESKKGTRVIKCTVCGAVIQEEEFSMTPEEIEARFKDEAKPIFYQDYDRYWRSPKSFEGDKVYVRVTFIAAFDNVLIGKTMTNELFCLEVPGVRESIANLMVGKTSVVYGTCDGIYNYKSQTGATITIPAIKVKYYG